MNEQPIKFAAALCLIAIFLFLVFKEEIDSNVKIHTTKNTTEVAMFCEFIDLGTPGFEFSYDEANKKIYYSSKNIKPRDIKFEGNVITFTVDSNNLKYYNIYEYNKDTKLFKEVKDSTGAKANIGKVACITAEENQKKIDDAQVAYYRLKEAIEKNLKDPDSAKWGDRYITKNKVCVTVNSKNSFGGYVGNKSYCATKSKNSDWKLNL